jgi:hypothetical protein
MTQSLWTPFLRASAVLLATAVILPLVLGLIARALFFRRDPDDTSLPKNRGLQKVFDRRSEVPSPEPDPLGNDPWPDFGTKGKGPSVR